MVATAFHGGAVLGTMATEDEAWEIYDQWPKLIAGAVAGVSSPATGFASGAVGVRKRY